MVLIFLAAALACTSVATDGDSIRLCSGERVRLLGVDAPELSRCRPGRVCALGDPIASRDNLRRLIDGKALKIERIAKDRYGRTIARVRVNGRDLSCAQLAGGYATYKRQWDNGLRIWKECGDGR